MKVYVLEGIIDYEGSCLIGVFDSRDAAEKAFKLRQKELENHPYFAYGLYDSCEITETEIGELIKL